MVCNLPKPARNSPNLKNLFGPTAPTKEMGPYKPRITNDDPSFRQVSIG